MNKYWFRPKRYGYGAAPSSWEGWALVALYALAMLAMQPWLFADPRARIWTYLAFVAVLTASFVAIARIKTDGAWRWRDGRD